MQKRKGAVQAVFFDLDGTLVDSLADIAAAVNSALLARGQRALPVARYRELVGHGLRSTLTNALAAPLAPEAFETALAEVRSFYAAHPADHTEAYPGTAALLQSLGGWPLGVYSNKDENLTRAVVDALFPGVFQAVLGAREGVPSKPDAARVLEVLSGWGVEPGDCLFLGDTAVDIETARRGGLVPCGAGWGYRDAELRGPGVQVFEDAAAFGRWLVPLLAPRQERETASTLRGE